MQSQPRCPECSRLASAVELERTREKIGRAICSRCAARLQSGAASPGVGTAKLDSARTTDRPLPEPRASTTWMRLACIASAGIALTFGAIAVVGGDDSPTGAAEGAGQTPAPQSNPPPARQVTRVSEESKNRIASFLEKAGKLRAMTSQGTTLEALASQLADLRGAWDGISVVGLPDHLRAAEDLLGCSVKAWTLTHRVWAGKARAVSAGDGEDILFTLAAGTAFGCQLDEIEAALRAAAVTPPAPPFCVDSPVEWVMISSELQDQLHELTGRVIGRIEEYHGRASTEDIRDRAKATADAITQALRRSLDISALNLGSHVICNQVFWDDLGLAMKDIGSWELSKSRTRSMLAKMALETVEEAQAQKLAADGVLQEALKTGRMEGPAWAGAQTSRARLLRPDAAVKWCMAAAALAFDAARNSLSASLR